MNDWTKAVDKLPEAGIPVCFELLVSPGESALPMQGSFDGIYFVALDGAEKPHCKFAPRLVFRWRHATTRDRPRALCEVPVPYPD